MNEQTEVEQGKAYLASKFRFKKTFAMGNESCDRYVAEHGMVALEQFSGSNPGHNTNPFSWRTFEGTTVGIHYYRQTYSRFWNKVTVYANTKQDLQGALVVLDKQRVIKRPVRR